MWLNKKNSEIPTFIESRINRNSQIWKESNSGKTKEFSNMKGYMGGDGKDH